MAIVTIGILAQVDAARSTLTERHPDDAGSIGPDRQPHCLHEPRLGRA
jgi:hypothetical protein